MIFPEAKKESETQITSRESSVASHHLRIARPVDTLEVLGNSLAP
jgi:hypothetical protein